MCRTWRDAACLAALAVAASVAGCSDAGSELVGAPVASSVASSTRPPASTVPSAPPSVSPSASPSYQVPAAARAQSEAGAIAFVKFYFDQMNKAWMGPDTKLLPPLSDPECQSCAAMQDRAAAFVTAGDRLDRPIAKVLSTVTRDGAPPGQLFLVVRIRQNEARTLDDQGVSKDVQERSERTRQIAVIWKEDRWLLYGMAA